MYEISRAQEHRIVEEVKLGDDVLVVDFDVDRLYKDYAIAYNNVLTAQNQIREMTLKGLTPQDSEEVMASYGNAITSLILCVFGEDNVALILEFFEERYQEMLTQIMPFIEDVFRPKLEQIIKDNREQYRRRLKATRRKK